MQNVIYNTITKLICSCVEDAEVILCISPSTLVATGLPTIEATLIGSSELCGASGERLYQYVFNYDETLLTDPTVPLYALNISGVVCRGCLTTYIDTNPSFWRTLGNVGTDPSVNFLGTADDTDLVFRVNNSKVMRYEYYAGVNHIVGGHPDNTVAQDDSGCAILSGGGTAVSGTNNIIRRDGEEGPYPYYIGNLDSTLICGGRKNIIEGESTNSVIGGGYNNKIKAAINSVICGGASNLFTRTFLQVTIPEPSYHCVISGGQENTILSSGSSNISGGARNSLLEAGSSGILSGSSNTLGIQAVIGVRGNTFYSTIVGGYSNSLVYVDYSSIAGGVSNTVSNLAYYEDDTNCGNVISGGVVNTIKECSCSAIIGGAGLSLGTRSCGFQSNIIFRFNDTFPYLSQTDVSGFSDIAYFGDVDIWVGNVQGVPKCLKFFSSNSSLTYTGATFSSFKAGSQSTDIEYVLPTALPTPGQKLEAFSVSGTVVTLKWV